MSKFDDASSWLYRIKQFLQTEPQSVTELVQLLREAQARALIDADTLAMIEGVILLSQMKVRDVMLPRKQMTAIDESDSLTNIIQTVTTSGHSRFPVMNKDEVVGILHAKDLLRYQSSHKPKFNLTDIMRPPKFVPEGKRLDLLLKQFRVNRNHMAIVVDEYGTVAGLVTLEDIVEQVIGEIEDEFDIDEETDIKALPDGLYTIKAQMPIEDFNEFLKTNFSDEQYDTIGGIVMAEFGHLPNPGEMITIDQFEFKVLNADGRTINLLECRDMRKEQ